MDGKLAVIVKTRVIRRGRHIGTSLRTRAPGLRQAAETPGEKPTVKTTRFDQRGLLRSAAAGLCVTRETVRRGGQGGQGVGEKGW